jgi:hypothetical protein
MSAGKDFDKKIQSIFQPMIVSNDTIKGGIL